MKQFTNLYPLQKTLRFELKPIGNTLENIKKSGILTQDEERAEQYKKVKKTLISTIATLLLYAYRIVR